MRRSSVECIVGMTCPRAAAASQPLRPRGFLATIIDAPGEHDRASVSRAAHENLGPAERRDRGSSEAQA